MPLIKQFLCACGWPARYMERVSRDQWDLRCEYCADERCLEDPSVELKRIPERKER